MKDYYQDANGEENDDNKKKKRKKERNDDEEMKDDFYRPQVRVNQKVIEFYRATDTSSVLKKSDMFKDMEFYIVNVDDLVVNKPYLEQRIVEHGGVVVQNLR